MKHIFILGIVFAVCVVVFAPAAEAAMRLESSEHWVRVEFDSLPQTAAEVAPGKTPEETAALTVAALVRFTENQEAGIAMLNVLRGPRPLSQHDIQLLKDQLLRDRDYVARSHFNGATPENDYTPIQPYSVTVSDNPNSYMVEGYATLYIRSGGADSPASDYAAVKAVDGRVVPLGKSRPFDGNPRPRVARSLAVKKLLYKIPRVR